MHNHAYSTDIQKRQSSIRTPAVRGTTLVQTVWSIKGTSGTVLFASPDCMHRHINTGGICAIYRTRQSLRQIIRPDERQSALNALTRTDGTPFQGRFQGSNQTGSSKSSHQPLFFLDPNPEGHVLFNIIVLIIKPFAPVCQKTNPQYIGNIFVSQPRDYPIVLSISNTSIYR